MASLVVPCQCGTKLAAPESAVGKQIRCPKCGALTTVPALVPAEEVPVVDAKVTKPAPSRPDTNVTCCTACNAMIATIGKPPDGVVRCPNCGFANTVRNRFADPDDDAEEEKPRKKSKVRAAAVDEDDEDDEDDRPRKKRRPRYADEDDDYDHDRKRKKPKRKAGGSGALVAGLIVGGLLLVCVGIGVAVYAFSGKGGLLAKKAPVPPGWEEHNYPQDGFRAYMPQGARYTSVAADGWQPGGVGGRFGGAWDWGGDVPPIERIATLTTNWNGNNGVHVDVTVIKFRSRVPASVRDAVRRAPGRVNFGGVEMRTVKWLGYDAVEQAHANSVMRVVYTDRHAVIATVSGPNVGRAKPEEEAAFFDNIEVTN